MDGVLLGASARAPTTRTIRSDGFRHFALTSTLCIDNLRAMHESSEHQADRAEAERRRGVHNTGEADRVPDVENGEPSAGDVVAPRSGGVRDGGGVEPGARPSGRPADHEDQDGERRPVIEARGLVKVYPGGNRALDGVSFRVGGGEVFAFLGPNGSGKTTTVKILTTLRRPTQGWVRVNGRDPVRESDEVRRSFGIV